MSDFRYVDLTPHLNAVGGTFDSDRSAGALNAWGNTFPAEEVPFGGELLVGDLSFSLPVKRGPLDHVETLGQVLTLGKTAVARGMALLCLGEMGVQDVEMFVSDTQARCLESRLQAGAWLVPRGSKSPPDAFACTHLHYRAGYELDLLRPCMWAREHRWARDLEVERIRFGVNPLVHVFAVTLIAE